jgi:hypothetical protein
MPILEDVKNAGFPGLFLLLLGVVGLLLSALAVAFAASRQRAAFGVGLAALLLAALLTFGGALGTIYGRHLTDDAVSSGVVSKVQAERIRRIGHTEARSAAKLGLLFAVVPLLAGAFAALVGAQRRKEPSVPSPYGAPQPTPTAEGGHLIAPFLLFGLDLLGIGSAAALMLAPLPGRPWEYDDPTWELAAAVEEVLHPGPTGAWEDKEDAAALPSKQCKRLEQALESERARREELPELPEAASRCVEATVLAAAAEKKVSDHRRLLEELAKSPLVLDDETRRRVNESIAKLPAEDPPPAEALGFGDLGGAMPKPSDGPAIKTGQANVSGRLAPEVIQRVVRASMGRVKACYEKGLITRPSLQGTVKVRFVIGRDGKVASADSNGSDMPDQTVVSCVVRVVASLSFPEPEGGIVTVVYPFRFNPGP